MQGKQPEPACRWQKEPRTPWPGEQLGDVQHHCGGLGGSAQGPKREETQPGQFMRESVRAVARRKPGLWLTH